MKENNKNKELKRKNEILIQENILLKNKTTPLNSLISILDKDISCFKNKYQKILKNITK